MVAPLAAALPFAFEANEPALTILQTELPCVCVYEPLLQRVCEVEARDGTKLPALAKVQLLAPCRDENEPKAQAD